MADVRAAAPRAPHEAQRCRGITDTAGDSRALPADDQSLVGASVGAIAPASLDAAQRIRDTDLEPLPTQCVHCHMADGRTHSSPRSSCIHLVLCRDCHDAFAEECDEDDELAEVLRFELCEQCARAAARSRE